MSSTPTATAASSRSAEAAAAALEAVILRDPGQRGVGPLGRAGDLWAAALALQACASRGGHVGIITGFYIVPCAAPETDGPLGALHIARAVLASGGSATLLTDTKCGSFLREFVELVGMQDVLPVVELDEPLAQSELHQWLTIGASQSAATTATATITAAATATTATATEAGSASRSLSSPAPRTPFDQLISIERVGPASDGRCYNMRGEDISAHTPCGVAELWRAALEQPERFAVTLIGVGDGGNEVGMGLVAARVREHIPRGERICCALSAHHLLVTGVSNWGGLAVAALLYRQHSASHSSEQSEAQPEAAQKETKRGATTEKEEERRLLLARYLPSVAEEREHLRLLVKAGFVDGISKVADLVVDGIHFDEHHRTVLEDILDIAAG